MWGVKKSLICSQVVLHPEGIPLHLSIAKLLKAGTNVVAIGAKWVDGPLLVHTGVFSVPCGSAVVAHYFQLIKSPFRSNKCQLFNYNQGKLPLRNYRKSL